MNILAPGKPSAPGSARRHPGLALFLGALLLLAQFAALAHGLGHLHDHEDPGGAPEPACEWCLNFSQLGAAVPATGPCQPALGPATVLPAAPLATAPASSLPYRYHSRAPPHA